MRTLTRRLPETTESRSDLRRCVLWTRTSGAQDREQHPQRSRLPCPAVTGDNCAESKTHVDGAARDPAISVPCAGMSTGRDTGDTPGVRPARRSQGCTCSVEDNDNAAPARCGDQLAPDKESVPTSWQMIALVVARARSSPLLVHSAGSPIDCTVAAGVRSARRTTRMRRVGCSPDFPPGAGEQLHPRDAGICQQRASFSHQPAAMSRREPIHKEVHRGHQGPGYTDMAQHDL